MDLYLNDEQSVFLDEYKVYGAVSEHHVPMFLEEAGKDPVFLPGYAYHGGFGKFERTAPKGLWLGGGALMLYVPQGIVSIPDRRNGGTLKPAAQGWARYDEGADLRMTAWRECQEELTLYVLAGEGDDLYQSCTEIVPIGMTPKGQVTSLNLQLDDYREYGEVERYRWCRSEKDRAWIYVGLWDLRTLPHADRLRVIWDDDFPEGRRPGTNPRVLDWESGTEIGRFEGLQGYLQNNLTLHAIMGDEARFQRW